MKVCMIVNNPLTNDSRVLMEAESLAKIGCEVTIYATKKKGLPRSQNMGKFSVKRAASRYDFRGEVWKILTELIQARNQLVDEKADVYHSHDLDTLAIAYLVVKKAQAKLVYDSHELSTERYFKKGPALFSNLIAWSYKIYLRRVEASLAPKASWVITVNDSIAEELKKRYGLNKVTVVMNCQSKMMPSGTKGGGLREILKISQKTKIILYEGYMTPIRGLDKLVEAIKYVEGNVVLVLMGEGDIKEDLERQIIKERLGDKVKFLPLVKPEEVSSFIADADIGVIPYQNICLNNYYSTPNKLFDFIGAGVAVVASDFPQLRKIILENKIGLVFDETDPQDIAAKINEIISDEKKLEKMKQNAKRVFETKYNWETEEKKFLDVYKGLS